MDDLFDAISVGSGLGGLTAGALAALEGKRVLVLEPNPRVGGAATCFTRGGVRFEAGLHQIEGLDRDDPKAALLDRLGVRGSVEFLPTGEVYRVRHPLLGEPFTLPCGAGAALEAAVRRFPGHAAGIRTFFDTVCTIRRKVTIISRHDTNVWYWIALAPTLPFRFRIFARHERTCLGPFLDGLFGGDEAVKIALAANLIYSAADPTELSLLFFSAVQGSFLLGGSHYIRGGAQALSDHLARIVTSRGGGVETGRRAERILVEGGRTAGVAHVDARTGGDPRVSRARAVFGNAAPGRLAAMLPEERREAFEAPYGGLPLSTSLWQLYLSLDRPAAELGVDAYSTFVFPDWHRALRDTAAGARLLGAGPGSRLPPYVLVDYDRLDGGRGPAAPNRIALCGPDALPNWAGLPPEAYRARKAAWIDALLADLDRRFPGMRLATRHAELATARTMRDRLGTPEGAVYGFAQTPSTSGRFRPKPWTAVPGVYLASSFTRPGGGFTGAMLSGACAFRAAKKDGLLR